MIFHSSKKGIQILAVTVAFMVTASAGRALGPAKAPILVLQSANEFGAYTGEILRAEGFNEFQVEFSDRELSADFLSQFDVIILTATTLNSIQGDLLGRYVRDGGNLIAFCPEAQLAPVFGISDSGSDLVADYIKIEANNEIGKGLLTEALQFHGKARQYRLRGAQVIATFYRNVTTPTGEPAIVRYNAGNGHAIAFTYNLPQSIALTRQGNSRHAGLEKDGITGIRAADMFADGWIDPLKTGANQADEQMRLLSHAIESLESFRKPLPRLWYFPGLNRSVVLLTGDGEDSTEADFDAQLADIKSKSVRMTLYLKGTYIPAGKVKSWLADGFEISAHVDDTEQAEHPTYDGMDSKVKSAVAASKEAYGVDVETVRNHWIVWCGNDAKGAPDFTGQAAIEAKAGIRLDCNFYHFDQKSALGHFLGPIGNFTGSGLPMKFITARGEVLDIYQSLTQLPDEQWGKGNLFGNFKILLDRSVDHESYSFINVNLHTDRWKAWSRKEGLQIIDYANERNVPVWTAARTLKFLQSRDAASFADISWSNNQLSFQLNLPKSIDGLTCMIPKKFGDKTITNISRNTKTQPCHFQSIKGSDYALVATMPGDNRFVITYGNREEK